MADQPEVAVKVDTYVKLYERQMAHYENTQGIEWKVNIGVWTLLVAAIAWASTNTVKISARGWGISLVLVVVAHALWLGLMHSSEEEDKRFWCLYRAAAEDALGVTVVPKHVPRPWWKSALWLLSEVIVTAGMALLLFLVGTARAAQVGR